MMKMGSTIWVLKEGQDVDDRDHSVILDEEKELKRLARELVVKGLHKLLDYSDLVADFGGTEEPEYLDASDIKPTLVALIQAIKAGRSTISAAEDIEELEDCLRKVLEAENQQCKVRLAVIP
jgi:hypothetical protein